MFRCIPLLLAIVLANGQFELEGGLSHNYDDLVEVTRGGELHLECHATAETAVVWKHNGMPVDVERASVTNNVLIDDLYVSTMTLGDVSGSDAGSYECTNPDDYFDKATIGVTVIENTAPPAITITEPEEDIIYHTPSGDTVTIACEAPESVTLKWSHNHEELTSSENSIISTMVNHETHVQTSLLTIPDSALGVENSIVCEDADNWQNNDSMQILLREPEDEEESDEEHNSEDSSEEEDVDSLREELASLRSKVRDLCAMIPEE